MLRAQALQSDLVFNFNSWRCPPWELCQNGMTWPGITSRSKTMAAVGCLHRRKKSCQRRKRLQKLLQGWRISGRRGHRGGLIHPPNSECNMAPLTVDPPRVGIPMFQSSRYHRFPIFSYRRSQFPAVNLTYAGIPRYILVA